MGVWIEILLLRLPGPCKNVAPFVGVWIEIFYFTEIFDENRVAPFVGVWIEITNTRYPIWDAESLPSWECGLKLFMPF